MPNHVSKTFVVSRHTTRVVWSLIFGSRWPRQANFVSSPYWRALASPPESLLSRLLSSLLYCYAWPGCVHSHSHCQHHSKSQGTAVTGSQDLVLLVFFPPSLLQFTTHLCTIWVNAVFLVISCFCALKTCCGFQSNLRGRLRRPLKNRATAIGRFPLLSLSRAAPRFCLLHRNLRIIISEI